MGSSGSGRFGNYHISDNIGVNSVGNNTGIGGGNGEVECPRIIENIRLEDVATSEFYIKQSTLPTAHSKVQLRSKIHLGRLVVETIDTHQIIGNLPTQYNYLINCIKNGLTYSGDVISSGAIPIPFVVVTLSV